MPKNSDKMVESFEVFSSHLKEAFCGEELETSDVMECVPLAMANLHSLLLVVFDEGQLVSGWKGMVLSIDANIVDHGDEKKSFMLELMVDCMRELYRQGAEDGEE